MHKATAVGCSFAVVPESLSDCREGNQAEGCRGWWGRGGFAAFVTTRGYVAGEEVGAAPVSTEMCLRSVGRVG